MSIITANTSFLEKIVLLSPETLRVLSVDDVQDIKWQPQFAEAILRAADAALYRAKHEGRGRVVVAD